jgi:hypothetical protein
MKDSALRAAPNPEDVARPVDLVNAGTVALPLPETTPHWQHAQLPGGRRGWLYRPNLAWRRRRSRRLVRPRAGRCL